MKLQSKDKIFFNENIVCTISAILDLIYFKKHKDIAICNFLNIDMAQVIEIFPRGLHDYLILHNQCMAADGLAMQGTSASAATVKVQFCLNSPASASAGLNTMLLNKIVWVNINQAISSHCIDLVLSKYSAFKKQNDQSYVIAFCKV